MGRGASGTNEQPSMLESAEQAVDAAVLRVQEAERELRLARNAERQARSNRAQIARAEAARQGGS